MVKIQKSNTGHIVTIPADIIRLKKWNNKTHLWWSVEKGKIVVDEI